MWPPPEIFPAQMNSKIHHVSAHLVPWLFIMFYNYRCLSNQVYWLVASIVTLQVGRNTILNVKVSKKHSSQSHRNVTKGPQMAQKFPRFCPIENWEKSPWWSSNCYKQKCVCTCTTWTLLMNLMTAADSNELLGNPLKMYGALMVTKMKFLRVLCCIYWVTLPGFPRDNQTWFSAKSPMDGRVPIWMAIYRDFPLSHLIPAG